MDQPQSSTLVAAYVRRHGTAQLLFWSAFYYLLPALTAQIVSETNWPVWHLSTTYTLAFLLWAFCAPAVGHWIDAGHGAKVIRIGSRLGVVLLVGLSQTNDRFLFSGLVILLGACMAATLYDPCFAVMMRRLKQGGTDAVATVTLIAGFATALTFPLIYTLSSLMTWQHIALSFAVLAAIGVILLPTEPQPTSIEVFQLSKMRLEQGPMLIAFSFGLVMMGHAMLLFLLPVALVQDNGFINVGVLALAILGPAQIAGRMTWKYVGSSFRPQSCAIVMFACLCLPATLLLMFGTASIVVCAALTIQGACYGVHTILRPSLAQHYVPASQLGRGLGVIAMIGLLLMAVGPAVGGLIWTLSGLSGLMITILLLNVMAFGLGAVLCRKNPKGAMV